MIYLIRSFGRGKSLLKVGFTKDMDKRMENYYHSNPCFEKITSREGDEEIEKLLHFYLELLGYKYSQLDEWFIDSPVVLSRFHDSAERIKTSVWKERDKVFKKEDLKSGSLKRKIYDNLFSRYYRPRILVPGTIDWDYKFLKAKEDLKKNSFIGL